jgi:hypothetical protein
MEETNDAIMIKKILPDFFQKYNRKYRITNYVIFSSAVGPYIPDKGIFKSLK